MRRIQIGRECNKYQWLLDYGKECFDRRLSELFEDYFHVV